MEKELRSLNTTCQYERNCKKGKKVDTVLTEVDKVKE
jgi:hypothetical protein